MKSFSTKLIAALVIGSMGLASDASACNGGNRGGNGRNGGQGNHNYNNNQACNSGGIYNSNINASNVGGAYEPFHSMYTVEPGDSLNEVSLKEYGSSTPATYIAKFNRLAPNAALVAGQRLWMPSISANGQLTASRAPMAETFNALPNALTASKANFAKSSAAIVANPTTMPEPPRPSVPTGSAIKLDGQSLGSDKGVVRLRISSVAMPVEVLEWSAESTTIRLPKLDVNGGTKADLEVVRADGTIAATNAIELTAAISGLASAK
jgi:hypothetical protein